MAAISLEDVTKVYKGGTTAVRDLNLEIEDGEFIVLVGPSGCGKTTALRMVAGLEEITSGTIRIGDRVVNDVDPGDRDIAMVFQNYALYPHMTVFDNIAFPLRVRRVPKAVIRARVTKVADLLGLSELLSRKPRTLSGGQRQRVAMGRALVREPQAFLMDEPLSNLDAKLRVQMRSEISNLQKELGITTMYVTHDQVEAMTMGMKIAVMRLGVLQQYGAPTEVYADPVNIFVAAFIGSPGMNFMKGQVARDDEGYHLALCGQTLRIPSEVVQSRPALASCVGRRVALGVRPEHLSLDRSEGSCFSATVARVEMLGAEKLIHVVAAAEPVLSEEVIEALADVDAAAVESLEVDQKEHHVNLVVRADSSTRVAAGENVQLFVVPGGMHFFELKGGQAIKC